MSDSNLVNVRMFGVLDAMRREQGLSSVTVEAIPAGGMTARDLAISMGLPPERIEGVFCNHTIYRLTHIVRPGDEVAFVPYGTPGPHRYFLGLYEAGQ